MFDLIIRGDRVVTPQGTGAWDICILGETIAAIAAPGNFAFSIYHLDRLAIIKITWRHRPAHPFLVAHSPFGRGWRSDLD